MIKWHHLILTLVIGIILGIIIYSHWPEPDNGGVEDPQIHRLNAEIGWRQLKEKKIKDSLKIERKEKVILAKENIELRKLANQSDAKFQQHHLNSFLKNLQPINDSIIKEGNFTIATARLKDDSDKIEFLIEDTTLCDSALQRSQDLVQGLTKEIINDNKELAHSDSLNANLEMDKRDLKQADSLHVVKENKLIKSGRKKFLRGLGIGGVLGIILALLL